MATNYKVNGVDLEQIFSQGGGSGGNQLPIGTLQPMLPNANMVVSDASTWLKTGVYIDDPNDDFPDAPHNGLDVGTPTQTDDNGNPLFIRIG